MNFKQISFATGAVVQLVVLGVTLHYLNDINQKQDTYALEVLPSSNSSFEHENHFSFPDRGFDIPFKHHVMGAGKIRPSSDYVIVDTILPGRVENVFVQAGDQIREGDVLFQITDANYRCALREKLAEYDTSIAQVNLLYQAPSRHEIAAKEKEVAEYKIKFDQQEKDVAIFDSLLMKSAVSLCEKEEQETLLKITSTQMEKVLCELDSLNQGPSPAEIKVTESKCAEKEASVQFTEQKLKDCRVTAPISGKVLSVNINAGEYIDHSSQKGIVIGCEDPLHLKVRISEKDAWRISPTQSLKAIAVHKSNPKIHFILDYVSHQPCLQEEGKLELTFSFEKGNSPVYLEQSLDVYIDAASPNDTSYLDYQFNRVK